jgi:hypothetical protein
MATDNRPKSTANRKKEDGKFHAKKIKHDPNAESARSVFGLDGESRLGSRRGKNDA